jgi:hypothetical protein
MRKEAQTFNNDEMQLHITPILLGEGFRLFEHLGAVPIELENTQATESLGNLPRCKAGFIADQFGLRPV